MTLEISDHEVRLRPEDAAQLLASLAPLRSSKFIDAILGKIEEQLPAVQAGELANFYVTIEVWNY